MSKFILITIHNFITVCYVYAQQKKNDPVFDNWFAQQPQPIMPQTNNPPPPPGVPLDGGLIALIAAGGAMGYKKYKEKNVE